MNCYYFRWTLFYHNFVACGFWLNCSRFCVWAAKFHLCPKAQGFQNTQDDGASHIWLCQLHFL